MPQEARLRARRRVRMIVAVSVPVGLVLSVGAAALTAHQDRERMVSATRWQLAVTAEAVSSRLDVQAELTQLSAAMLTPAPGVAPEESLTMWQTHMQLLGVRDGAGAGDAVSWVRAARDPEARRGAVELGPPGGTTTAAVEAGAFHLSRPSACRFFFTRGSDSAIISHANMKPNPEKLASHR